MSRKHGRPVERKERGNPLLRLAVTSRVKKKLKIPFWMERTKSQVNGPGRQRLLGGCQVLRIGGFEKFHVTVGHEDSLSRAAHGPERSRVRIEIGFRHGRK